MFVVYLSVCNLTAKFLSYHSYCYVSHVYFLFYVAVWCLLQLGSQFIAEEERIKEVDEMLAVDERKRKYNLLKEMQSMQALKSKRFRSRERDLMR